MLSIAYGDQPKRGWFGRLEILSFVRRVLYRSPRDWDIAGFKVSERRPVIGELRSSGGAVACRLVEFTLRIGRENSRIASGSPTIRAISRCDLVDVLLRRLVRLARHPWRAGRTQFRSDWSARWLYNPRVASLWHPCPMASKNLEMYRTFAL